MKTEVKALFQDFNAGAKKDIIKFEVKGDLSDEQIVALHKLKGGQVFVQISSSQLDIDDLDDDGNDHVGIEYSVGDDGVVNVAPDQMSIDDMPSLERASSEDKQQAESGSEPVAQENVADIEQERKRRGRPKKAESESTLPEQPEDVPGDLPPTSDDDLPF